MDAVERGVPVAESPRRLSLEERVGDVLITGLRLVEGVRPAAVEHRYGVDVRARYGADVRRFVDAGWMIEAAGRWRLTRAGMLVSNEILSTFV